MGNVDIFRVLIANAAIIFSGVYLMGRFLPLGKETRKYNIKKIIGVSLIAISSLFFPVKYENGILIDLRMVPLATFGLISGMGPALLAALLTGTVRLYLGGDGAWGGFLLACILPAVVGGILHLYDKKASGHAVFTMDKSKLKYLMVLAVISWLLIYIALYFIMPGRMEIFKNISFLYFIVLLGAYYFMGIIIIDCMNAECYRERLEYEASTDFTTDLINYRYFMVKAEDGFSRCTRAGNNCSVLLIDIDDFKRVNDTYGHLEGNRLLTELSELLIRNTRSWDVVARYGGEEFIIFMENTGVAIAKMVAERIRKKVEQALFINGRKGNGHNVTVSIGIAVYPQHGHTLMELIQRADEALYEAKKRGKNISVIYGNEKTNT